MMKKINWIFHLLKLIVLKLLVKKNYVQYSNNIGIWPEVINDTFREYFIMNPPNQNMCKIGSSSKLISGVWRKLNESSFFCVKKNNAYKREWLIYSHEVKKLFCYVCKLFNPSDKSQLCQGGFDDWTHVSRRLNEHENS